MKSWFANINGILLAATLVCGVCGCKTTEQKQRDKLQTLIRLHVEVNPDGSKNNEEVAIYRARPEMVRIQKAPFLDSASIDEAGVVEMEGGWGIRIQFDLHGTRVLENVTAMNVGKRIAVYAIFPRANTNANSNAKPGQEMRWLAAPQISHRLSAGSLVFTPDATKEESERIVLGINNLSKTLSDRGNK